MKDLYIRVAETGDQSPSHRSSGKSEKIGHVTWQNHNGTGSQWQQEDLQRRLKVDYDNSTTPRLKGGMDNFYG